jgi:hypothetical protein
MQKSYFHNSKSVNASEAYAPKYNGEHQKLNVDINTLLNRVKIDERNEKKQKILFFFSVILVIIMLGSFISILK